MPRLFQSYVQSDFGGEHKNFEAVVLEGSDLWHWWRDNSADGHPWRRGQKIVAGRAAFAASIIQSSFGSGGRFAGIVDAELGDYVNCGARLLAFPARSGGRARIRQRVPVQPLLKPCADCAGVSCLRHRRVRDQKLEESNGVKK